MFFEERNEGVSYELNIELAQFPQKTYLNVQDEFFETPIENETINIPCHIFREGLSGLEAIIKYLKEEHNLKYFEIAKILNRDQRTIWTTYNKIKNKKIKTKNKINQHETISINSSILQNRDLSILEAISTHLKNTGFTNKKISEILGKNSKTIWTVLNRAKQKTKSSEVAK